MPTICQYHGIPNGIEVVLFWNLSRSPVNPWPSGWCGMAEVSHYSDKCRQNLWSQNSLKDQWQWTVNLLPLVHLIQLDKKEEEFNWNPADIGWQSQQWVFLSSSSLPDFPGFLFLSFVGLNFILETKTFRLGPLLHTWCLLPGSIGGTRIVFALVSILTNPSFMFSMFIGELWPSS